MENLKFHNFLSSLKDSIFLTYEFLYSKFLPGYKEFNI